MRCSNLIDAGMWGGGVAHEKHWYGVVAFCGSTENSMVLGTAEWFVTLITLLSRRVLWSKVIYRIKIMLFNQNRYERAETSRLIRECHVDYNMTYIHMLHERALGSSLPCKHLIANLTLLLSPSSQ